MVTASNILMICTLCLHKNGQRERERERHWSGYYGSGCGIIIIAASKWTWYNNGCLAMADTAFYQASIPPCIFP